MSNQFISPNWHVLFIHYPLALLSSGIIIELFSFLWPRGLFRAAGRWMIVLGALTTLPALTAGMYAFRAAVAGGSAQPHLIPWYEVVRQSPWSHEQWNFMSKHIWLNSIGVLVVVAAVGTWIAVSDLWRRRLYWPVMAALICGMGLFAVGSWFGGESVYRYGTAVGISAAQPSADTMKMAEPEEEPEHGEAVRGIKWYIPPLELHIVLAGIVAAIALGTLALTIRRLERPALEIEPPEMVGPGDTGLGTGGPRGTTPPPDVVVVVEHPYPILPGPIHAGRFWLLAFLAALCTGVVGLWSAVGRFTGQRLSQNGAMLTEAHHSRLLLHTIFGACIILLPLVLAPLARFGRRRLILTSVFLGLLALVIAFQIWLGLAMLYDGHEGPPLGFNSPSAAQTP